jgi:hypothetical protein
MYQARGRRAEWELAKSTSDSTAAFSFGHVLLFAGLI